MSESYGTEDLTDDKDAGELDPTSEESAEESGYGASEQGGEYEGPGDQSGQAGAGDPEDQGI